MSTLSIKSRNTKSAAPKKGSAHQRRHPGVRSRLLLPTPRNRRDLLNRRPSESPPPRLTLLSQPEGASIEEMMQATDWQQHSVRGFLAGTVKRKLGFSLTSLKPNGGVRRYLVSRLRNS